VLPEHVLNYIKYGWFFKQKTAFFIKILATELIRRRQGFGGTSREHREIEPAYRLQPKLCLMQAST